jgi:hypothetical protein
MEPGCYMNSQLRESLRAEVGAPIAATALPSTENEHFMTAAKTWKILGSRENRRSAKFRVRKIPFLSIGRNAATKLFQIFSWPFRAIPTA